MGHHVQYPNQKVMVIGHKNPDTDSICSAVAYAYLKNQISDLEYEARRAGNMNQESAFALNYFGVTPPRMCTDILPKVRNVEYRQTIPIRKEASIREAWDSMRNQGVETLPIVTEDNHLDGLITIKRIAVEEMDSFDNTVLAKSRTPYKNMLQTLSGTLLLGDENGVTDPRARVIIGTANPEILEETLQEGDIVILSNRFESQLCAIEMGASLLVVCQGQPVSKMITNRAKEKGCAIMSVPSDTYTASKLINQSVPVGYIMSTEDLIKFTLVTPVESAIEVMARERHRYFPILDADGYYCGMLSHRNVVMLTRRKMILVDHNEKTQAVDGYDQAEILEIIDHHRIGSMETIEPVYFRNEPVGCTATIITQIYEENDVEIPRDMAGLLLSAILSDTLKFTSPTCTPLDKKTAEKLAAIAGVDIDKYATEMFSAGEQVSGKTAEELFLQDFKVFMVGDRRFGVMQGSYLTRQHLEEAKDLLRGYMDEACTKQHLEDLYIMLTDIAKSESVVLVSNEKAAQQIVRAFSVSPEADGSYILPGVISRKKQLIPRLMESYTQANF